MKRKRLVSSAGLSILSLLLCTHILYSQGSFWQQTNGPNGGTIWALATNSEGHIFAGSPQGIAVFRSVDNGLTWTSSSLTGFQVSVMSLAINQNGHVFAGTNRGVFRSTDNGATWTQVNSGLLDNFVRSLAVNTNGDIFGATFAGVFRSTDNGDSWSQTALTSTFVRALATNSSGHVFAGAEPGGVFRSTDGGTTWSELNSGLTNTSILSLAVNSSGHIFAGTNGGGLFVLTDVEGSWVQSGLPGSVLSLAMKSSEVIFAGTTGGVFRSMDSGASWTAVNTGLTFFVIFSLVVNASGHIFAGTDAGGVFSSSDDGGNWTEANSGLISTVVFSVAVNATGDLFAAAGGSGVFRSTDSGGSWTRTFSLGFVGFGVVAVNPSTGVVFAGGFGGLFRSTDNGEIWTPVGSGVVSPSVTSLAFNSSGDIFAGTIFGGIFRSTDGGLSWTETNSGLTNTFVMSLAVTPSNVVVAGTSNGAFRSTDNGGSWSQSGLAGTFSQSLAISPSGDIFAGGSNGVFRSTDDAVNWIQTALTIGGARLAINSSGHIFAGFFGLGVYRSTDDGATWNTVNSGLTNSSVASLVVDASDFILAGTYGSGVFRSTQSTVSAVDVAITSVTSNLPLPNPNAPLQIFATVTNTGSVEIASVEVRIFLDQNSNLVFESGEPSVLTTVTDLLVGTSQNVVGNFQCPPAGSYLGVAVADPGNLIAESNEGNNVGSTSLNVLLADLTATALTSTSSQMANGNYQVSLGATVANIGQLGANNVQVRFAFSTNEGATFTNIGGPVNAGTIAAGGTATATKNWNNVSSGTYLIQVSADPNDVICEGVETNNVFQANITVAGLPATFDLSSNYPNPFNPSTTIRYQLPKSGSVSLKVYNVLGEIVATLVDQIQEAGYYEVRWSPQLPSGIYLYRLQAGEFDQTRKLILVR